MMMNIAICNAGLVNGLTEENVLKAFLPYGDIENVIMLPGKSCGFVVYKHAKDAEKAFQEINGVLNLAQDGKPLYLLYTTAVPDAEKHSEENFPSGLILIKDFVTKDEEMQLLSSLKPDDSDSRMKHRKVKHYGYEFRYDINNVDKDKPLSEPVPETCSFIFPRFHSHCNDFDSFIPDQLTVNEYQPGQGIPPHVDTHSAFEDPILSLSLGSSVNMDFKRGGKQVSVLLPGRSLLVMSGESRYAWTHGITPRKYDIVSSETGLTVQERSLRLSLTFRKVLRDPLCKCNYPEYCDSHIEKSRSLLSDAQIASEAEKLEELHVHKIYDEIAGHFSETRHKAWPKVLDFVMSFPSGSILVDVGCGNGKYLGHNQNAYEIGCDHSLKLIEICQSRGFEVFNCNCLNIPLKTGCADGAISIAVIHHLASEERRLKSIREMVRILRKGGRALIYVWAKDQNRQKKSSYLKQDRKNRKEESKDENVVPSFVQVSEKVSLPVHNNRTQFQYQDSLVPWKLKQQEKKVEDDDTSERNLFLRFYHVFEEGELENLCMNIAGISVIDSYYDDGNWCIVIEKSL